MEERKNTRPKQKNDTRPRNDNPKDTNTRNDKPKDTRNDNPRTDKPKDTRNDNPRTDNPKNDKPKPRNNYRSRNNENRRPKETFTGEKNFSIEKITKKDDDATFYELYFKEQEKIRLKEIEIEKMYKPPEEWVKKLIPIVFK